MRNDLLQRMQLNDFAIGRYVRPSDRKWSMRWDTVLNKACTVDAAELDSPYFHTIRCATRARRCAGKMPYALIVTLQAPGVADLMARVQAEFPVLQTLPVGVQVPVDGRR